MKHCTQDNCVGAVGIAFIIKICLADFRIAFKTKLTLNISLKKFLPYKFYFLETSIAVVHSGRDANNCHAAIINNFIFH